jgi:hypothetical protein
VLQSWVDNIEQRGRIIFEEGMSTPHFDEFTSCRAERLPAFHSRPAVLGVVTSVDSGDWHAYRSLMLIGPEFGQPDLGPDGWQYESQYALILKNLIGCAQLAQDFKKLGVR